MITRRDSSGLLSYRQVRFRIFNKFLSQTRFFMYIL